MVDWRRGMEGVARDATLAGFPFQTLCAAAEEEEEEEKEPEAVTVKRTRGVDESMQHIYSG